MPLAESHMLWAILGLAAAVVRQVMRWMPDNSIVAEVAVSVPSDH